MQQRCPLSICRCESIGTHRQVTLRKCSRPLTSALSWSPTIDHCTEASDQSGDHWGHVWLFTCCRIGPIGAGHLTLPLHKSSEMPWCKLRSGVSRILLPY